jgi:preprotein translocase subunit Sss1
MAERGTEEIRQEIAAERRRLDEARDGLRAELRSLVPVAVVGLVVVGIITARMGFRAGLGMVRKLS